MNLESLKKTYDQNVDAYYKELDSITAKLSGKIFEKDIKIHSLKSRVKTFESLHNKIKIKKYETLGQCTDIIGCRVVCLFKDQVPQILKTIEEEFNVIESFEKGKDNDKIFAYSSHHLIIKTTHYCEIQVRTILQEAWAEMEHHVNYKNVGADKELSRKINALAALFEIADDQFYQIHQNFVKITKKPIAVTKELNGILLYNFCKQEFSWGFNEHFPDTLELQKFNILAEKMKQKRILNIRQLKDLLDKHLEEIYKEDHIRVAEIKNNPSQWPKIYEKVKATNHFYSPVVMLNMLLNTL